MKSNSIKIVLLFALGGIISGLLTIILSHLTVWVIWLGVGLVFLFGLATSYAIARRQQWILVDVSPGYHLLSALIITVSYPTAFIVMLLGTMLYDFFYRVSFPDKWAQRVSSGDFDNGNFAVGLMIAAAVSSFHMSYALKLITKRWYRDGLGLFILAGLVTIPLSRSLSSLFGDPNSFLYLLPVGQILFSALFGYWLVLAKSESFQLDRALPSPIERHR